MCTILIARRAHPRFPLVLAANRDELRARPWAPPAVLEQAGEIWGGRDLAAGGTWLGVAQQRFVTAVTNHRTHHPPDPRRPSRGALVMELLRGASHTRASERVLATAAGTYNGANLLYGDVERLSVAYLRDDAPPSVHDVPLGLSVLTNGALDDTAGFPKIDRLIDLAQGWPDDADDLATHLHHALGDHALPTKPGPPPPAGSMFTAALLQELQAVCVHTDLGAGVLYGTVSSSILMFRDDGMLFRWHHTLGSPCTHGLERFV